MTNEYKSTRSESVFTATGEKSRAYLKVTGHAASLPKVKRIVDNIRTGGGTFDQVDCVARQLSRTY